MINFKLDKRIVKNAEILINDKKKLKKYYFVTYYFV